MIDEKKHIIKQILSFIQTHNNFLITTHARADADAIGSCLALNQALKKLKKNSHVVCKEGVIPEYSFLPGGKDVGKSASDLKPGYNGMFVIDCANIDRLESVRKALPRVRQRRPAFGMDTLIINIDHHASNTYFADINWVDPSFASTSLMIYKLIKDLDVKMNPSIATNIYVGLVTDTGGFAFSNTDIDAHLAAAELIKYGVKPVFISKQLYGNKSMGQLKLLARCIDSIKTSRDGKVAWSVITKKMIKDCNHYPYETQEFITAIRSLKNVKVAILFRVLKNSQVKVSFRTSDNIDGSKLASIWGGGGHERASGALIKGTLKKVECDVVSRTIKFVNRCLAP